MQASASSSRDDLDRLMGELIYLLGILEPDERGQESDMLGAQPAASFESDADRS